MVAGCNTNFKVMLAFTHMTKDDSKGSVAMHPLKVLLQIDHIKEDLHTVWTLYMLDILTW